MNPRRSLRPVAGTRVAVQPRAPDAMPLWTVLDMTPGGRGTDWYPRLAYGSARGRRA